MHEAREIAKCENRVSVKGNQAATGFAADPGWPRDALRPRVGHLTAQLGLRSAAIGTAMPLKASTATVVAGAADVT